MAFVFIQNIILNQHINRVITSRNLAVIQITNQKILVKISESRVLIFKIIDINKEKYV